MKYSLNCPCQKHICPLGSHRKMRHLQCRKYPCIAQPDILYTQYRNSNPTLQRKTVFFGKG